jgi:hypothetical protein
MWPGPEGQAAQPNGFSDNGYLSTWDDADGAGFYASLDSFIAAQGSAIPVATSAHVGLPNVNFAYAGAEAIIAAGQNVGFGPEGLNIYDPISFAAGIPPTTLNDWAENFQVFQNKQVVRYLQLAVGGGNAEQFALTSIVVSAGTATANCSNGDCSVFCSGVHIDGVPLVYLTGAGSGLNGTMLANATCATNTVSFSTGVGDGTYPGGTIWTDDYLPITLPFAQQENATAIELHECELDYAHGTTTVGNCAGTSGPDVTWQQAIAALIGSGPPSPPAGLTSVVQ